MFAPLWPDVDAADRPVRAITNGVHVPTWVAADLGGAVRAASESGVARSVRRSRRSGRASWRFRTRSSGRRAAGCARICSSSSASARASAGRTTRRAPRASSRPAPCSIPTALTIGFARRFTGYKRPDLVFRDFDRLLRLIVTRPIVRCSSCSPARRIRPTKPASITCRTSSARRSIRGMAGRIAFVDDYDLHVAHLLVQGCDVWLNTPRKPLEASGTSGMKASMNGTLHLSIGDGWWAEGFTGDERLGHRGPHRARPRSTRWTPPTPTRCTHCSKRKSCRRSTSATRAAFRAAGSRSVKQAILTVTPRFFGPPHAQGLRRTRVRAGVPETLTRYNRRDHGAENRRNHAVRDLRRQGRLRAPRRRAVLPRLLGQEDRGRGNRRARVHAKRYIRAQNAEKHLVFHSTQKRPIGQLLVIDDGYDLFLTVAALSRRSCGTTRLSPRERSRAPHVRRDPGGRGRRRHHRALGRRQVAPRSVPLDLGRTRRLERGAVKKVTGQRSKVKGRWGSFKVTFDL